MKQLITCILMMLTIAVYSQNGGQSQENNSVKLEYAGASQTKLTNKQAGGAAVITVKYNNASTDYTVAALSSILLSTPIAGKITAKTTTNWGDADFGLVELTLTAQLLPVKFVSLKVAPLGNNEALVEFEIAEATNVSKFNIQASSDGKTWRNVTVVLPDNIQPNRLYQAKINLSTQNN